MFTQYGWTKKYKRTQTELVPFINHKIVLFSPPCKRRKRQENKKKKKWACMKIQSDKPGWHFPDLSVFPDWRCSSESTSFTVGIRCYYPRSRCRLEKLVECISHSKQCLLYRGILLMFQPIVSELRHVQKNLVTTLVSHTTSHDPRRCGLKIIAY